MIKRIHFAKMNAAALRALPLILPRWLPDGNTGDVSSWRRILHEPTATPIFRIRIKREPVIAPKLHV